jgi:hypothetical protein
MKAITQFTKQNLPKLRTEIDAALAKVLGQYGLEGSIGNISFTDYKLNTKLVVEVTAPEATEAIAEQANDLGKMYGIAAPLGTVIRNGGRRLVYIGIEPSRRKYPIKFRLDDGHTDAANSKVILFTTSVVDQLNKAASDGKLVFVPGKK